jgi:nitrile hydratase beta subunit
MGEYVPPVGHGWHKFRRSSSVAGVNSAHDVGGMQGFGPVVREENEPAFHDEWEKSVFAVVQMLLLSGRVGTVDGFRHAIERMGNATYLSTSYYEHWLAGAETLAIEHGVITVDELRARTEAVRKDPVSFALPRANGPDALSELAAEAVGAGFSGLRDVGSQPRFAVGDDVLTSRRNPTGHTRLPRYARGRRGRIAGHHGAFDLADTLALGPCECPEHLYAVRFEASELWGDSAADGHGSVTIDLWESYLDPVDAEG